MTLAELVERRLEAAGIGPDDPGLVQLREWNRGAYERGRLAVELRRGQFGSTRRVTLDELESAQETAKP